MTNRNSRKDGGVPAEDGGRAATGSPSAPSEDGPSPSHPSREYMPFSAYDAGDPDEDKHWWCAQVDMAWHFPGRAPDMLSSLHTIYAEDEKEAQDLADYLNRVFYAGFAHAHQMPRSAYEVERLAWEKRHDEEQRIMREYQPRESFTLSGWLRKLCRWYLLRPLRVRDGKGGGAPVASRDGTPEQPGPVGETPKEEQH